MNILYLLFFIPFPILFSFQPAVGETRHNLELNLKKTYLDTKQVSLTKDKTYFLTSSIINQNQVIQNENDPIKSIVTGSLLSPKGTILHGNLSNSADKRPRIKIYYTEPNIE